MKMNPILKKELRLGSRSIKLPLAIMFYNLLLAVITVLTMAVCNLASSYGSGSIYDSMMSIFPILAWTECMILLVVIPVIAAGSIASEREKQTLDIMLTTPIKPFSIIVGKVFNSIASVLMFVISSIPIMSVAFIFGGLNWFALLGYIVVMVYISYYVASIGVFCSSLVKKTILAIILTIIFEVLVFIGTGVIYGIIYSIVAISYELLNPNGYYNGEGMGICASIFMFNPLSTFLDYTLRVMGIGSLSSWVEEIDGSNVIGIIITKMWIPISAIINIAIALFLNWIAAKRINPIKKVRG